jgi:hypothetical protein
LGRLEPIGEACSGEDEGGIESGEEPASECDIFALLFGVMKEESVDCFRVAFGVSTGGKTVVGWVWLREAS